MPSIDSLLPKLIADFPEITFLPGPRFSWSPSKKTVFYDESEPSDVALLLHELSHGLLGHQSYAKDVELLAMEASAWGKARELAADYKVKIDPNQREDHLDTYRDWLHDRSTCPSCQATGYQTKKDTYTCVACGQTWRVNEARLCGLKRYVETQK